MGKLLPQGKNAILLPGNPGPAPLNAFIVDSNLVGYWGLDSDCLDFTAAVALDLSQTQPPSSMANLAASAFGRGMVDGALTFNGSSSKIVVSTTLGLVAAGTSYTISGWFNSSSATTQSIFAVGNSSDTLPTVGLLLLSTGAVQYSTRDDANNSQPISSPATTYGNGLWHHGAIVQISKSSRQLWLDAALVGTNTNLLGTQTLNQTAIGVRTRTTDDLFFNGALDDIRIYNRALDAGEIWELYAGGIAGLRTKNHGLSYWDASALLQPALPSFIPAWAQGTNLNVVGGGVGVG